MFFAVFLILTPLMAISGYLSLKLAKHIEKNEKEKKKKGNREKTDKFTFVVISLFEVQRPLNNCSTSVLWI